MRIAVFTLARPTFDTALASEMATKAVAALAVSGVTVVGNAELLMETAPFEARLAELRAREVDAVLVLQASFCDATMAVRLAQTFEQPIVFWAFPEPRTGARLRLNAFCGLNLAAHALGLRGRTVAYAYAPPERPPELASLIARPSPEAPLRHASDEAAAEADRALDRLAGHIGLVGEHPPGFDTCDYDEAQLRRLFGIGIARISLDTLFRSARRQSATRIELLRRETAERIDGLDGVDPEALDKALRCYAALDDAIVTGQLKGVAIRCWPETFTEYGCAVCGAVARLNEERTPGGCEADVLGVITSRLLQELAGTPAMLSDIVDMNDVTDTTVLWHCGQAPLSMCDPEATPRATVHSNRRKPLLHEFPLKPGPVTLARLSQARGVLKLLVGRGRMIRAPLPFSGTAGTLVLDGGTARCRDLIVHQAIEHHVAFVYGDVKPGLLSAASRLGLPVLDLDAAP